MNALVVIAIVLIALASVAPQLARYERAKKERLIEDRFGHRGKLDTEGFYEAYFSSQEFSRDVVSGVREVLQSILDVDISFLRDSDDFSKNLSFFWDFDSMANVELVQALEERFQIQISDQEAESAKTVRQLIELVQRKVRL